MSVYRMALRRATSDIGERLARLSTDAEVAAAVHDYARDARILRLAVTVTLLVAGVYATLQVRKKVDDIKVYDFTQKLWMGATSQGIVPFLTKLWVYTLLIMAVLPVIQRVVKVLSA